ncbi:hypothetical protein E6H34_07730 [Candidatus Bathyarchaeota archaeon]|nr:MAG: hypothetical protein E6H34_07730 [Candidatus Bathyarchaeota archaeon]
MLAIKVRETALRVYPEVIKLLEIFRRMINDSIKIGLETNTSSLNPGSPISHTLNRDLTEP